MPLVRIPQNSFASGILSEARVRDRYDVPQYDNGARELFNVCTHPQGGVYRRPGTIFLSRYTSKGTNFRFMRFDYSDDIAYLLVIYAGNIDVWRDDVLVHTITGTGITAAQVRQLDYVQRANALIMVHGSWTPKQLSRGANDTTWTLGNFALTSAPLFPFTPTTSTPAGTATPSAVSGTIKVVASSAVFTTAMIGGWITGNGGEGRIMSRPSTTEIIVRVTLPFVDTTAIPTGQWEIEAGYEAAWSSTRGFPRAVGYHGDSLFFASTRSLPDVFWKSEIGNYNNFDDTRANSNSPLSSNVKSDDINDIRFIVSGDDLVILTSDSEFYIRGNVTPDMSFEVRKQEERGCRNYIKPLFVDGAPVYIDALADVLRELTYSDVDAKYSSTNLSIFASGLIKDPFHIAHQRPAGERDNDYVWIVNGDGTWVMFNTLRKQKISAFTTAASRSDQLITCEDLNGTLYAMFRRSINGETEYYLEKFSFDVSMDCCKVYEGPATDTIEDLDFLEGETVKIKAEGHVHAEYVVEGGEYVAPKEYTKYEVGFPFPLRIVTLPPSIQLPDGTSIGQIRRLAAVSIGMSETAEILVNGQPVRNRRFGQELFDTPPPLISGRKRVTLRGGYGRDPVLTIEQIEPLDFHITGLVLEVVV